MQQRPLSAGTVATIDNPWQRSPGTMPAFVEDDHDGHTSLAGGERKRAGARALRQCAPQPIYTLRHRVHPAQACPDGEATVSLARHKARIPAPLATYLCVNGAASYQRPSKGFAVARPRAHANNGDLHPGGSVSETGSFGGNDATQIAVGALQSNGRTDRVA